VPDEPYKLEVNDGKTFLKLEPFNMNVKQKKESYIQIQQD
jgi:hypothetical protein